MPLYDPFDDQIKRDAHPVYKRMRSEAPVYFVERWNAWALFRFEDIWQASMDNEHLTVTKGTASPQLLTKVQPVTPMLNNMDPPEHTRLRALLRAFFMPRRVREVAPTIEKFVAEQIDFIEAKEEVDLVGDFGEVIGGRVACLVAGFPLDDGPMLTELVRRFFAREEGFDGMGPDGLAAMEEMFAYFHEFIANRRAHPSEVPDPLNMLLAYETAGGEKLDDASIASHLSMLLIGGAETFPKVFANAVYRLGQHPEQRAECAADPSLIPGAFNEALRYDMPTQWLGRTVTKAHEIQGHRIEPGQVLLFVYPSGNRDEREFENADAFDIHRRPQRILSFGHGQHACIGLHVARMEGKLALEALLKRFPATSSTRSGSSATSRSSSRDTPRCPSRFARRSVVPIERIERSRHRLALDPAFEPTWDSAPRPHFDVDLVRVYAGGCVGIGSGDSMAGFEGNQGLFVGRDALALDAHRRTIERITFHYGRAWPLEVALCDLAGKLRGEPCWRIFGGESGRLRLYASAGQRRGPNDAGRLVENVLGAGFEALKLRFRHDDWREDLALVRAVRAEAGSGLAILADCNQAWRMPWDDRVPWRFETASEVAEALADQGVFWMEEPLDRFDVEGMRRLREQLDGRMRIAGGEMLREPGRALELARARAVDVLQTDAVLGGGIGGLLPIAREAGEHGVAFTPHTWGDGIVLAANAHLLAAAGQTLWLEYPFDPPHWTPERRDFVLREPLRAEGGALDLGDRAGLGIELDPKVLEATRVPSAV